MLKGTRDGILKRIQPVSIHGQISCDVFFTDLEDPDGQTHLARLGPEAIANNLEPGDRIQVEYLVGVPIKVSRVIVM
jgi:phosphopantothenate synthetase